MRVLWFYASLFGGSHNYLLFEWVFCFQFSYIKWYRFMEYVHIVVFIFLYLVIYSLVLSNNPETNSFNFFTSKFFLKMPQLLLDEISCWKIVCDERVGRRCAPLGSRFDQNDVYHPFYLQNKLVIKCTITFQNWLWVYKNQKRSPRPLNGGKCFLNRTPRPKS